MTKPTEDETLFRLTAIYGNHSMDIILKKVLDDFEKARKYDTITNDLDTGGTVDLIAKANYENRKLRDVIEGRIEELIEYATEDCEKVIKMDAGFYCDCECCCFFGQLQKLLEDSNE